MRTLATVFLIVGLMASVFVVARPAVAIQGATPAAEPNVSTQGEHVEEVFTPVLAELVGGDTAAVRGSDGLYYVVYEIRLTNTASGTAQLEALTVVNADDGVDVVTLTPDALIANESLRLLNREPTSDMTIPPYEARLVLLSVTFAEASDVPSALVHRVDVLSQNPFGPESIPFSYQAAVLDLSQRTPPVLSPPLEGEGWIAAEGCCDTVSHHRNGMFPINGTFYAGQRFAIDFIQVDADGFLVRGDHTDPNNWIGYGKPVLAAADGVVLATQDGLLDQVPGIMPDQSQMPLIEIDGNHVVIEHDSGFYTIYGHLQPGSVMVSPGDRVRSGDQIASLGNTGGSQAPHLHFHVVGEPAVSAADGFPFVFDSFLVVGAADPDSLLAAIEGDATFPRAEGEPSLHEAEMPLSYVMVDFPPREASSTQSGQARFGSRRARNPVPARP